MGSAGEGWFLLGAPWDCSGTNRGEAAGPEAMRSAGLGDLVNRDFGDVPIVIESIERDPETGVLALHETVRAACVLRDALVGALGEQPGHRPLIVGGDCSILLGIFPALRRAVGRVGLWFVDGHPDYQDGLASETGETADLELAVLTGRGAASLTGLAGEAPMLRADDTVLLGHRSEGLDDASRVELARLPSGLARIDAATLAEDPAAAGERAAERLGRDGIGTWLHVDLDVLDGSVLPAVTYPQSGGPDWEHLAALLRPLARSPRLIGLSVADLRPDLDPTGAYAARVVDLLEQAIG